MLPGKEEELNVGFVVCDICCLKVPAGAMQESFRGEYNCLFGDRLWEDPYCCAAYVRNGSLDKEAPEEHMCLSRSYCGSGPAGELYLSVWFSIPVFGYEKHSSLRQIL